MSVTRLDLLDFRRTIWADLAAKAEVKIYSKATISNNSGDTAGAPMTRAVTMVTTNITAVTTVTMTNMVTDMTVKVTMAITKTAMVTMVMMAINKVRPVHQEVHQGVHPEVHQDLRMAGKGMLLDDRRPHPTKFRPQPIHRHRLAWVQLKR